jgi:dienelactone hydrolase
MAGFQKTKPNTWKDFIAAAEYLIAEKYTSPAYLGIRGGSAGGVLISNAITERPDLFRAAQSAVGLNNALRFETTPNGIPNIAEFGTFKTEEGFKALLAMDGYNKVKDGVKYPAVILTHGINDPRVEPWMSAKMAARLQAATASGRPVLLRIDYDAGHGIGSSLSQGIAEQADVMASWNSLGTKQASSNQGPGRDPDTKRTRVISPAADLKECRLDSVHSFFTRPRVLTAVVPRHLLLLPFFRSSPNIRGYGPNRRIPGFTWRVGCSRADDADPVGTAGTAASRHRDLPFYDRSAFRFAGPFDKGRRDRAQ